ncbi:hypothetical protein K438DRAFT_488038 [Mycena galopus ATCC 62051]|nr:hypothetical protein K438DRAFT_488038 [Mycena galopus ATCC 62051]
MLRSTMAGYRCEIPRGRSSSSGEWNEDPEVRPGWRRRRVVIQGHRGRKRQWPRKKSL